MYIDEKILEIIFRAKTEKELNEVIDDYMSNISEISLSLFRKYFNDNSIPKPRIKGLKELSDKFEQIDSIEEHERNMLMRNAMLAAASTPEFSEMMNKSFNFYNEKLIDGQLEELEDNEIDTLLEYIDSLMKNISNARQIFTRILNSQTNTL